MPTRNTHRSYGGISRTFHWLTALLIFAAFPLGLIANDMAIDTPEQLAEKVRLFSIHKTIGVAVFAVALARILWALAETRPAPLHPDRRMETFAASAVHWALYLSLVIVPLSGWVHHAALDGFAPILWPLGQNLPFVPKSETVAGLAGATHWLFTKVFAVSVLLHIAGALKHAIVDGDLTMARMTSGAVAGPDQLPAHAPRHGLMPLIAALAIFAAGAVGAWQIASYEAAAPAAATAPADAPASAGGNWQVTEGTLGFTARQMGAAAEGSFPGWTAEITFDEATGTGSVSVQIDMASVTLGSVTDQARGTEFLDTATHPTALFEAQIAPGATGHVATGTLTLRGATKPVSLPFALTIDGDTAMMTGTATLDRRDFGIGPSYPDEKTVGFVVEVGVALKASRKP